MRVSQPNLNEDDRRMIQEFSSLLLYIGDGRIGDLDELQPNDARWITVPPQYHIPESVNGYWLIIFN